MLVKGRRGCKSSSGLPREQKPDAAVEAVDRLFEHSGGRAIFLDQPIQRAFRDVHAMRAHAINNPQKAAGVFARSALGVEGREFFL